MLLTGLHHSPVVSIPLLLKFLHIPLHLPPLLLSLMCTRVRGNHHPISANNTPVSKQSHQPVETRLCNGDSCITSLSSSAQGGLADRFLQPALVNGVRRWWIYSSTHQHSQQHVVVVDEKHELAHAVAREEVAGHAHHDALHLVVQVEEQLLLGAALGKRGGNEGKMRAKLRGNKGKTQGKRGENWGQNEGETLRYLTRLKFLQRSRPF